MTPAIQKDAALTDTATADFNAEDAFVALWGEDATEPSTTPAPEHEDEETETTEPTEATETDPDEAAPEDEGQAEDGAEAEAEDETPTEKRYADSDDLIVKHTVDGEEREFKIGDLKRLAGQEASITRKGMETATKRKQLDEIAQVQYAAHEQMVDRARKRWEPYSKVDFALAAAQLDPEEYKALRTEAEAAYADLQFFESGLQEFGKKITADFQSRQRDAATECIKVLADPEKGIKGWDQTPYRGICDYAVEQGLDKGIVQGLTDPAAIKLLHKAMLYDRAAARVVKDKAAAKAKKTAAPKKIVKGTASLEATKKATKPKADAAMQRLAKSGSRQDAADAFIALWNVGDED